MALLNDWEDATKRDTAARSLSQGFAAGFKPFGGDFGSPKQPDIPAADAEAYKRQSASTLSPPGGFVPRRMTQAADSSSTSMSTATPEASPSVGGFKTSATSQPGVSRVTGSGMSSPMYTNNTEGDKATSGAAGFDGRSPETLSQSSTPFAGGFNPGQREQMISSDAGFGFKPPESLQRFAADNAAKQSMIDSQPAGGFGMLGSQDAMGRNQQERENDEKTARWRQDALISEAKYRPQLAGIASDVIRGDSQQAVEGVRQQGVAAGFDAQRRGQDLNFRTQMSQQELAARGQDLNAARDSARLGIEMGRFGLDSEEARRRAAAGNSDWRLQVTPSTRAADGSTSEGSVIRYNQRTGQVEKIGGGQANDARAQALAAIKSGANRDAVNQRLKAMGLDAV